MCSLCRDIGGAARAVFMLIGSVTLLTGCMPGGVLLTPVSTKKKLVETTLTSDGLLVADKIAVIDLEGILLNGREPRLIGQGEHVVSRLMEQLDKARADRRVRGVILRVNSPGGSVVASELMHDEIADFRRRTGKPVVAVMMDVAASGAYYVACACDRIVAQRSTVTGSIGVIMQLLDLSGTMRKIGLAAPAITSGENKAAGSPFKALDPDERAIFQSIVDQMFESFVEVVDRGRPGLAREQIVELADGRVYAASQALEAGLIDEIATLRETISAMKRDIGVDRVKVVGYRRPLGYRPNYYASPGAAPPQGASINLINVAAGSPWLPPTPRFLYLWAPGS